jgi:hypothetical protein
MAHVQARRRAAHHLPGLNQRTAARHAVTAGGSRSVKRPLLPAVAVNVWPVTELAVIVPGSGTGEPGAGPPTLTNLPVTVCWVALC